MIVQSLPNTINHDAPQAMLIDFNSLAHYSSKMNSRPLDISLPEQLEHGLLGNFPEIPRGATRPLDAWRANVPKDRFMIGHWKSIANAP